MEIYQQPQYRRFGIDHADSLSLGGLNNPSVAEIISKWQLSHGWDNRFSIHCEMQGSLTIYPIANIHTHGVIRYYYFRSGALFATKGESLLFDDQGKVDPLRSHVEYTVRQSDQEIEYESPLKRQTPPRCAY